ncbi:uncharacterized protein LOC143863265 [Tasmannia lanceolata]|uniref:uncharacterized protein LOC143863265 n=1 Tax=Tasmannia lanceolata TaxID=3420 RepID=UPI004062A70A
MVRTLLWQSMASHISRPMMNLATAKDIWDHAAPMFSGVDNLTHICATYSEWIRLERRNSSLSDHYSRFIPLCQQLNVFMPLTSDLTILARQRDQLRAIHYFESLGPDFLPFRQQLIGSGAIPSLLEIYSRAQQCAPGGSSTLLPSEGSALASYDIVTSSGRDTGSFGSGTSSFGRGRGRVMGGGRGTGGRGRPYCTHCQRDDHCVETCFVLHLELRHARAAHLSAASLTDGTFQSSGSGLPEDPFEFSRADYEELQRLCLSSRPPSAAVAQSGSLPASLLTSSSS